MSDFGNGEPPSPSQPPDEPTRAYTPVGSGDDATRLERPIEPYTDERGQIPPTVLPPGYREKNSLVAPLITVGLLCILIGIGLGYLLFHNTSSGQPTPSTTTSSSVVSTTSTTEDTTSTSTSTSTTAKPTTTTTKPTTTTSTTEKPTTTTKSTTTTVPIGTD